MRDRRHRLAAALLVPSLLVPFAACSDDGEVSAAHCEEIRDNADIFSAEGRKDVPGTLIGALREVVDDADAPAELRDAYEQLTDASGEEDVDEALVTIDRVVAECGVDLEG